MKIVHIITRLVLGGAQENTLITCRLLPERGHDVTLITGPAIGPEGDLFAQTKEAVYDTIVVDQMRREISPLHDISGYRAIKKLLKKLKPDIVHTHSAKAGVLGRIAAHKTHPRPKIVHGVHGLPFHPYLGWLKNKFYIAVEKYVAKKTNAFISVADAMTEKMQTAGIGCDIEYVTAYSAIDEEDFVRIPDIEDIRGFRRKYGIGEQAVVLVCIARLTELKGHDYIIESARRLAGRFENCIWLFVGDGDLADVIREDIQLANLQYRFKFTGLLRPGEIPLVIHSSDILVHCSLREGLARVLPQAMLCGKPAISFDIDGAREVVNENTGRLIEPEDVDGLTNACAELIENERLRKVLGSAARKSVVEQFAPATMVDTIESVYEGLLGSREG
jgi:glycosyltransferase involved in cell wall biosynthesis